MTSFPKVIEALPHPYYETGEGACYLGDSLQLMRAIPDCSINLIMTSPPFALQRQKEYGNVPPEGYVAWFTPFAKEFHRILTDDGSLVLDIGSSWNKGLPTKSLYHYELILSLCQSFHLAQEFFWWNKSRLPTPAQWVTVKRVRVKDAVDHVWWLSKTPSPKSNNRNVLTEYSSAMKELLEKGYRPRKRPSGHEISDKFQRNNGGAIPPNFLVIANTESNSYYLRACREAGIAPHPARYPVKLPEFFIRFLTDEGDIVLDPFAGSNVTGEASELLSRHWLSLEMREDYVKGSFFRFEGLQKRLIAEEPSEYANTK